MSSLAVILPAAGSGSRFGKNKLIAPLAGKPVLWHALRAFTRRDDVSHLIVPTQNYSELHEAISTSASTLLTDPRLNFCKGGAHRAESVRIGLEQLPDDVEWVTIHDAARPLVSQILIDDAFAAAREHDAAVPALPVNQTIKQAIGPLPAEVMRTVPRQGLWMMQTPQVMRRADLLDAFARCPIPLEQITDDAQLLELSDKPVWLIEGDERNIKITTPIDLQIAELLMRS